MDHAEKLDYKWWNPKIQMHQYITLDQASGKVITMTEVSPYDGHITIWVTDMPKPKAKTA